jgi:antitoxin component YwqK of YwqJK toxin-antitoxin module
MNFICGRRYLFVCMVILFSFNFITAQDIEKNGYNIYYYPTGKKSSEGLIRNGKPDGYWKTYFPTGVLKSEGLRRNFMLDSIWVFYNEKGDTLQKISYLMGKKSGYSLTYNTSRVEDPINQGKIITKELYLNDKKEGVSYYYYPDGKIQEIIEYRDNKRNGIATEYNKDQQVITIQKFVNGVLTERQKVNRMDDKGWKQGIWQEYYNNGRVKREMYFKDDILNGQYKEYDEVGNIGLILNYRDGNVFEDIDTADFDIEVRNVYDDNGNITMSGSFRNNIPVGIHRKFDGSGNVINALLYNDKGLKVGEGIITMEGKKEGNWIYFYENEAVRARGQYSNNMEIGTWKYYFINGKVEQTGIYKNGKYDGIWIWYYESGIVKREEEFFNGKEEGQYVEYDQEGNIIAQGRYFDGEKEGEWFYKVNDYTEKGSFIGDLRNGKWIALHSNGKIKYEGEYIQGNADGLHRFYYVNGKLEEEQFYISGIREKNWKKYNENGELILTITYRNNAEYRINGEKIDFEQDDIKLIQ